MSTLTESEQLRCNVVVEKLIKQYSMEELVEVKKQLKDFLGLFVLATA